MIRRSSLFFVFFWGGGKSRDIYIQHLIPPTPERNSFAEQLNHTRCKSA